MQAKDIPDKPILTFLATMRGGYAGAGWHNLFPREEYCPTVLDAIQGDCPRKVALAKMKSLIKRGLVQGCCCGCRGDFELTEKGRDAAK